MKPKPTLKLSLTKELPKKPKLSIQTPRHKYTSSLFTPKSSVKAILTTKARPSFSSFLIPTTPKSILTAKHHHTMSQQFPINPQSPRLIKITKNEKPDDLTAWKLQDFPVSPEKALFLFKSHLSLVELTEIHKFPEIYWIGIGANKIKSIGFDDEDGDFRLIVNDHISYRYEILQVLGSGSFGRVIKVFDHKAKLEIALKIIKNKPRFHEQAREEIEILNYLKTRDPESNYSIIHLNESFLFRNHICLTFELLGINLYQILKKNNFQGLSMRLIKKQSIQILQALRLMDRFKVIHCDLKPENILVHVNDSEMVKVIDFGSACFYDKRLYTYIQSRFYRAPEIILGLSYSTSIDMWSFGCILVELFIGRPIFPGESEADQLNCIMEVIGQPPSKLLTKSTRKHLFFESDSRVKQTANSKGKRRIPGTRGLKDLLKGAEEGFINLVEQCLVWDQLKRIAPDEALLHPWIQDLPCNSQRFKHAKTQSESALKMCKLFAIKETPQK